MRHHILITLFIGLGLLGSSSGLDAAGSETPTMTSSTTPTRTRTLTGTQTSISTFTRTPTPSATPTVTPTVYSNYALFKGVSGSLAPSYGQAIGYSLIWAEQQGLGSDYMEIVDTLPTGFNYISITATDYQPQVTYNAGVLSLRWGAVSLPPNAHGTVQIYGTATGAMGQAIRNKASLISDSGFAMTYSTDASYYMATATPTLTGFIPTTLSPTYSPTLTPSRTFVPNSPTLTCTTTPGPTLTPTNTPLPPANEVIDDFEDGDLIGNDGMIWGSQNDTSGSYSTVEIAGGCAHGTVAHSVRCHGTVDGSTGTPFAGLVLGVGFVSDYSLLAGRSRTLAFRVRGAAGGLSLTVQVNGNSSVYKVRVPISDTWTDVTIALPDHEAPGSLPQLTFVAGMPSWDMLISQFSSIYFNIEQSVGITTPFDFQVDDIRWGSYSPGASQSQEADAFGVDIDIVKECHSYGLSDDASWMVLVIAKHCGCHPSEILTWRSTLTWGQIAVHYGLTWGAVVDEAYDLSEAAGLVPAPPGPEEILRVLRNSPPTTDPLPTATPYVPTGPVTMPSAGGC